MCQILIFLIVLDLGPLRRMDYVPEHNLLDEQRSLDLLVCPKDYAKEQTRIVPKNILRYITHIQILIFSHMSSLVPRAVEKIGLCSRA